MKINSIVCSHFNILKARYNNFYQRKEQAETLKMSQPVSNLLSN